jgi:release factor glutamine methyltransferase
MRVSDVRARYRAQATNPRDVDLLISDVLGKSLSWVFAHGDAEVDERALEPLLARRFAGEPLQYIRGRTEFYGREFVIDNRVLIPRPETEGLVEAAIARAPRGATVIDVGTGSGCIAITIALERSDLRVVGVDASIAALAVASNNANRLRANIALVASDVLTAIKRVEYVVSNPPYIAAPIVDTLAVEVRDHEPRMALTPGPRGTEVIEQILDQAQRAPVLLEISYGQDAEIAEVARAHGYRVDEILQDLAAIPRVVVLSAASW